MQKKTDLQKNLDSIQNSSLQINQQLQQPQQQHIQNQHEELNRSGDWCSKSSSGQLRQFITKDHSSVPVNKQRKFSVTPSSSNVSIFTSVSSKDNISTSSKTVTDGSSSFAIHGLSSDEISKKPLIAKWKAGVHLQNTSYSPSTPDSKGNSNRYHHGHDL